MRQNGRSIVAPLALLATATGARTWTGVAAMAPARSAKLARVTRALALLEIAADKVPSLPNRTNSVGIIGRVLAGAFIGAAVSRGTRQDRVMAALAGGLVAFASAQLSFRARRALTHHLPATSAALIEDAATLSVAKYGASLLGSDRD
ncbi:MAG TPA: DUF4126 family protein [Gemmatimonadaceae bacterium]